MLENEQIKSLLESHFSGSQVVVEGDGYHYQVMVVSDTFEGLTKVKRNQEVYKILNEHIKSGALHALSIKPFTSAEWQERHNG